MLSCFGGSLFGKGSAHDEPPTVTAEETIRKLRMHIDNQEKRELYLDRKIEELGQEAKDTLAAGNKKKALALMKKRKLYTAEQGKIQNVKMTLESQAIHLESAAGTAQAFAAMSAGNSTMQKIRHGMGGVDQVDDMMMDMQEEFQAQEEVGQAIGQSVDPTLGMVSEDDLMAELEGLGMDDLNGQFDVAEGKKKASSTKASSGGLFGGKNKKKNKKQDAADLKALEAELAILS